MQIRILIVAALVLSVFSGCGGPQRPDGLPTLYPCELTITQSGNPLEGASVRLVRETGTNDWAITGRTDANGVVKIFTHDFAGAPEGTFKVLVSKTALTESNIPKPAEGASMDEWNQYQESKTSVSYVKPEYDSVKTSPHSITIVQGKNKETFDVGEPVEIRK